MAKFTYNGYTVEKCIGHFEFKRVANTFAFRQPFVITASSWAELKTECEKAEKALNTFNAAFEFIYGSDKDKKRMSFDPALNTGFRTRGQVEKVASKSFGKKQAYVFTLVGNLPAEEIYWGKDQGANARPNWFDNGFVELDMSVSYSVSRMPTITFTGKYLATAIPKKSAANAYATHVTSSSYTTDFSTSTNIAVEHFISNFFSSWAEVVIDVGPNDCKYDKIAEEYKIDDQNKLLDFTIVYRQSPFAYESSFEGQLRLTQVSFVRRIDIEMSLHSGASNNFRNKKGHKTQEAKSSNSGYANLKATDFPKIYEIRGTISVDVEHYDASSYLSDWDSVIRDWLINRLEENYGIVISYIQNEFIDFDDFEKTFSFAISTFVLGSSQLLQYTAQQTLQFDRQEIYKKIMNGKNFSFKVFSPGATAIVIVDVSVLRYGIGDIAEGYFTNMYPQPAFDPKTKRGWRLMNVVDQVRKVSRLDVRNIQVPLCYEARKIVFVWLEDSAIASAGVALRDSQVNRTLFASTKG